MKNENEFFFPMDYVFLIFSWRVDDMENKFRRLHDALSCLIRL